MKLKITKLAGIAGMFALLLAMASCSPESAGQEPADSSKKYINLYNWGDYIDESLFEMFTEETGIEVVLDTYSSNEEMYTKIKSGAAEFDITIPSDYMIDKMKREGLLEKINISNMEYYENISDRFKDLPYDPDNEYSVPYFCGTIGLLYNTTMVDDIVDSWDILWNPKYKGEIFLYDSMRNTIFIALKRLGFSSNTKSANELYMARDSLMEQKQYVQCYIGDMVKDKMVANEGALACVFSGDAYTAILLNEDLAYSIPKEGSCLWVDGMVIPKGAKHKAEAEQFIDFMCREDVSFINTEYIGYTTTNNEVLKNLPEEMIEDSSYWPTDEEFERCEMFLDLGDFIKVYDRVWTDILAYH